MNTESTLSTAELSEIVKAKPESIRVRLCTTGSYYGVKPLKLPNGRLLWPGNALEIISNYHQRGNAGAQ